MKFLYLLLFTIAVISLKAQEKIDTTTFNSNYNPKVTIPMMLNIVFSDYYPLSGTYNQQIQMNQQFFNYGVDDLNSYKYSVMPENSFYQYSKNGYSFWQNTNPLHMGIRYSFKELLGWKKLDVFVDAEGILLNNYDISSNGTAIPNNTRGVGWTVGAGVGYEIAPGSTLFIKGTASFNNLEPQGKRNFGGVNMHF